MHTLGAQLVASTDVGSNSTRFEFDAIGRRVKRTLPGGQ
jgi:YD repeat-containing protein